MNNIEFPHYITYTIYKVRWSNIHLPSVVVRDCFVALKKYPLYYVFVVAAISKMCFTKQTMTIIMGTYLCVLLAGDNTGVCPQKYMNYKFVNNNK